MSDHGQILSSLHHCHRRSSGDLGQCIPLQRIKRINTLLDYVYGYDKAGNIKTKTTEHGVYSYGYDDRYRPVSAVNPTLADETSTYDAAGNRLSAADITGTWNYNDANQLKDYGDVSQIFDLNGSPVSRTVAGVTKTYVYNQDNRLVEIQDSTGATIASYYYDPIGRRLWKDVAGTRTYFKYAAKAS